MKKTLAFVLCLIMALCSFGGLTVLAEAEEPVVLTMFVDETWWSGTDWDSIICKWMTEQTGVYFDVTVAADTTELDMIVASGSYPDVIVSGDFNLLSNEYVCYDYDYLLEEYGFEEQIHPAYKFVNQAPDGKYYCIMVGWSADYEHELYPDVNPEGECATARTDILEAILAEMGVDTLRTIEDLETAFELCKTMYPEVTPYILNPTWNNWVYSLYGAAQSGFVDVDGQAVLWINQPELKEALLTLNRWYRNGYMTAENWAWTDTSTSSDYCVAGKAFMCAALTNGSANTDDACQLAGVDYTWTPITDVRTDTSAIWTCATGWRGYFITKDCRDPEAAMRAILFFLDKDTGYTALWGFEGEEWQWDEDHQFVEFFYNSADSAYRKEHGFVWGYLGHDGISNNLRYSTNPKTRQGLAWVGDVTIYAPALGIIMNNMDTESSEYIIYEQLVELEENYSVKIATAETEEDALALYDEMMTIAAQLGAADVEAWANTLYPDLAAAYEEVRYIGPEGWGETWNQVDWLETEAE